MDAVLVTALLQKHDHRTGDALSAEGDRRVIWRSLGVDILLADPQVAPRHTELIRTADGWRVRDIVAETHSAQRSFVTLLVVVIAQIGRPIGRRDDWWQRATVTGVRHLKRTIGKSTD